MNPGDQQQQQQQQQKTQEKKNPDDRSPVSPVCRWLWTLSAVSTCCWSELFVFSSRSDVTGPTCLGISLDQVGVHWWLELQYGGTIATASLVVWPFKCDNGRQRPTRNGCGSTSSRRTRRNRNRHMRHRAGRDRISQQSPIG